METITLEHDIEVFYVQADSFPMGIQAAFEKLTALPGNMTGRHLYGISRPEGGHGIIYRAAAAAKTPGEGAQYGLQSFTIRKGTYISEILPQYQQHLMEVTPTFERLLGTPGIDPQGYCLEDYFNDTDIRCMVPLK
ncbi:MAG: hypothetical protein J7623_29660 [Chitinophaga sp.]|uniref:hypothetical protein n=1 Tax=Chitinophaga sp. TaxID=1869181 RepID=UPI001B164040|nr:hypothetical protein [Chitinophaga sp.]MBO9732847.1 hypothetical protein [Chitinophaga sp.]